MKPSESVASFGFEANTNQLFQGVRCCRMGKLQQDLVGSTKRVALFDSAYESDVLVAKCSLDPRHDIPASCCVESCDRKKEHRSLTGGEMSSTLENHYCDACPYCDDVCLDPRCARCTLKILPPRKFEPECVGESLFPSEVKNRCPSTREKTYTMCQLRRHDIARSAWLLVGDTIYDATSYVSRHPGGASSILRKSGGKADCSKDMAFHSKTAIKIWKKHKIGKLVKCKGEMGGCDYDNCASTNSCVIS